MLRDAKANTNFVRISYRIPTVCGGGLSGRSGRLYLACDGARPVAGARRKKSCNALRTSPAHSKNVAAVFEFDQSGIRYEITITREHQGRDPQARELGYQVVTLFLPGVEHEPILDRSCLQDAFLSRQPGRYHRQAPRSVDRRLIRSLRLPWPGAALPAKRTARRAAPFPARTSGLLPSQIEEMAEIGFES